MIVSAVVYTDMKMSYMKIYIIHDPSLVVSQRAVRRVTSSDHASIRDCIAKGLHLQKVQILCTSRVETRDLDRMFDKYVDTEMTGRGDTLRE